MLQLRKHLSVLLFCFGALLAFTSASGQSLKAKKMVDKCMQNMGDFLYDSYETTPFDYTDNSQVIPIEFVTYKASKYKIIFCSSDLEGDVLVNVYDKPASAKNRKKIYDTEEGIGNCFWIFQPPKTGVYYIEYSIPKIANPKKKHGYLVMIITYKM